MLPFRKQEAEENHAAFEVDRSFGTSKATEEEFSSIGEFVSLGGAKGKEIFPSLDVGSANG